MRKLTLLEHTQLKALTKQIHECFEAGYQQYFKAGEYLKQVREKRLWEEGFDSFKDYFEITFGKSRQRAYQLIETYEIAKELPKSVSNTLDTARQVNALKNVPKEDRAAVVEEAAKEGSITARKITAAAKAKAKDAEVIYRDGAGYEIPKPAQDFWQRAQEIQALMTAVSKVKTALEAGRDKDDPMYRRISQGAIDHLSRAYQFISDAKPFAVCLSCQGRLAETMEKCGACKGTGLVHETFYAREKQLRQLREGAYHLTPYAAP